MAIVLPAMFDTLKHLRLYWFIIEARTQQIIDWLFIRRLKDGGLNQKILEATSALAQTMHQASVDDKGLLFISGSPCLGVYQIILYDFIGKK